MIARVRGRGRRVSDHRADGGPAGAGGLQLHRRAVRQILQDADPRTGLNLSLHRLEGRTIFLLASMSATPSRRVIWAGRRRSFSSTCALAAVGPPLTREIQRQDVSREVSPLVIELDVLDRCQRRSLRRSCLKLCDLVVCAQMHDGALAVADSAGDEAELGLGFFDGRLAQAPAFDFGVDLIGGDRPALEFLP
jgi:hypothetical protein